MAARNSGGAHHSSSSSSSSPGVGVGVTASARTSAMRPRRSRTSCPSSSSSSSSAAAAAESKRHCRRRSAAPARTSRRSVPATIFLLLASGSGSANARDIIQSRPSHPEEEERDDLGSFAGHGSPAAAAGTNRALQTQLLYGTIDPFLLTLYPTPQRWDWEDASDCLTTAQGVVETYLENYLDKIDTTLTLDSVKLLADEVDWDDSPDDRRRLTMEGGEISAVATVAAAAAATSAEEAGDARGLRGLQQSSSTETKPITTIRTTQSYTGGRAYFVYTNSAKGMPRDDALYSIVREALFPANGNEGLAAALRDEYGDRFGAVTGGEYIRIKDIPPTEAPTRSPTPGPTPPPSAEPSTARPTPRPTPRPVTNPPTGPTAEPTAEPTVAPASSEDSRDDGDGSFERPPTPSSSPPTEEPTAEPAEGTDGGVLADSATRGDYAASGDDGGGGSPAAAVAIAVVLTILAGVLLILGLRYNKRRKLRMDEIAANWDEDTDTDASESGVGDLEGGERTSASRMVGQGGAGTMSSGGGGRGGNASVCSAKSSLSGGAKGGAGNAVAVGVSKAAFKRSAGSSYSPDRACGNANALKSRGLCEGDALAAGVRAQPRGGGTPNEDLLPMTDADTGAGETHGTATSIRSTGAAGAIAAWTVDDLDAPDQYDEARFANEDRRRSGREGGAVERGQGAGPMSPRSGGGDWDNSAENRPSRYDAPGHRHDEDSNFPPFHGHAVDSDMVKKDPMLSASPVAAPKGPPTGGEKYHGTKERKSLLEPSYARDARTLVMQGSASIATTAASSTSAAGGDDEPERTVPEPECTPESPSSPERTGVTAERQQALDRDQDQDRDRAQLPPQIQTLLAQAQEQAQSRLQAQTLVTRAQEQARAELRSQESRARTMTTEEGPSSSREGRRAAQEIFQSQARAQADDDLINLDSDASFDGGDFDDAYGDSFRGNKDPFNPATAPAGFDLLSDRTMIPSPATAAAGNGGDVPGAPARRARPPPLQTRDASGNGHGNSGHSQFVNLEFEPNADNDWDFDDNDADSDVPSLDHANDPFGKAVRKMTRVTGKTNEPSPRGVDDFPPINDERGLMDGFGETSSEVGSMASSNSGSVAGRALVTTGSGGDSPRRRSKSVPAHKGRFVSYRMELIDGATAEASAAPRRKTRRSRSVEGRSAGPTQTPRHRRQQVNIGDSDDEHEML
mmetsp:Transcript_47095/g.142619  ORF Transcript_47095/g.142619 Transcript_47095/m.142619 type:complete len:1194 (-) Transcript_47095:50-3631(-)